MSEPARPTPDDQAGTAGGGFVPVEPGADARAQADELLIHGLLSVLHERADGSGARRVERVMSELRGQSVAEPAGRALARRSGRRLRRLVGVPAIALAIAMGVWTLFELPAQQAKAAVLASASALNAPGSRRYEVRLLHDGDSALPKSADAVFDSRDGGNFLLRVHTPQGGVVIAGQDGAGEWAIRREGGIERDTPRRAWPRWSTDRGESLFVESVGTLMKSLAADYALSDGGLQQQESKRLRHITAKRRRGTPPHLADVVELWIDADSQLLERLEMNWEHAVPARAVAGPNEGPGPGVRRPPMNGPNPGERGPGLDRPPPEHPAGEPGFPGGDRPRGPRPERGPNDAGPGPGGRGPGEGGPPERAAGDPGDRRPGRPGPGGQGGPMGPGGRGPMDVGGPIVGKVIRQLVIQRVEAPTWNADWFMPEAHLTGAWGEPESR